MTNIKLIIEIALNDGYATKRYTVEEVKYLSEDNSINVTYYDALFNAQGSYQFCF